MLISDILDIKKDAVIYEGILSKVSVSLIYNEKMKRDIEKLYESDKYRFYKKAKECPAYNNIYLTMGGIDRELYSKKALGIVLCAEEDEELSNRVINFIKRYCLQIYASVKSNNIDVIVKRILELYSEKVTPMEFRMYENLSAYSIIKLTDKDNLSEPAQHFLEAYIKEINIIENDSLVGQDINVLLNEKAKLIDEIKNRIISNKGKFSSFEDLYYCEDEEISKYVEIMTTVFDFEKISISALLSDINLSQDDINKLILAYTRQYSDMNLERSTNVLVNGIIIQSLLKAYKYMKEVFFKNNKETLYLDLESLENKVEELKGSNHCLEEEIVSLKSKLGSFESSKENEIRRISKQYEQEINTLKKQLQQVDKQLEQERVFTQELNSLRETIFEIRNEYVPRDLDKSLQDFIHDRKVLIIGGNVDWRKKIKDKYPEILTLDGFNENFDITVLNGVDYLFFFVGYMNHATYYKAINYLRNKNIPFGYVGKTNIELVENEMVQQLEIEWKE